MQHTCKDFCSQVLPFLGRSFHGNRPLPSRFLVGPSPIHCTAQQPAISVAPGPENTDFHGSFGRRFEPSSFQMLKRTGETVIPERAWKGGGIFWAVYGLGFGESQLHLIKSLITHIVYSFTKTSSGIKLWTHHLEMFGTCFLSNPDWSIYHMCHVYIYIYHSPFRCVRFCYLVNLPEDPLDPVEDCSEEEVLPRWLC